MLQLVESCVHAREPVRKACSSEGAVCGGAIASVRSKKRIFQPRCVGPFVINVRHRARVADQRWGSAKHRNARANQRCRWRDGYKIINHQLQQQQAARKIEFLHISPAERYIPIRDHRRWMKLIRMMNQSLTALCIHVSTFPSIECTSVLSAIFYWQICACIVQP